MRVRLFVFAVACLFAGLKPSAAETLYNFEVAGWTGSAFSDPDSRKLSHCAAFANYQNGVSLAFLLWRDRHWGMSVANHSWSLTKGQTYDVMLNLDSDPPSAAQAVAVSTEAVVVTLGSNAKDRFMKARQLRMKTAGQEFSFTLAGTAQLMPALQRCMETNPNTPPAVAQSNPFVATAERGIPSTQMVQSHRAEATALVTKILGNAGITGFRIVEIDKSYKHDVYWTAGKLFGGIDVIVDKTPELISATTIGEDATVCKGKFASGSMPASEAGWFRGFTKCDLGDRAATAFFVIAPRPAGGYYMIATGSFESEEPARQKDADIRQAAFVILSK
jgi:hypothetical protein